MRNRLTLATLCAAVFAICPAPVVAQQVQPGAARVQMSDVTGPNVSSLLLFEVGTTKTLACPVAWGIRSSAEVVVQQLQSGTLVMDGMSSAHSTPSPAAQQLLLAVLYNGPDARPAIDRLIAALADSRNAAARTSARRLTRDLVGLLKDASALNPADPGYRTAIGLTDAVHMFNAFVDASSPDFLASPPAEFLVIETVLSRLVISSLENEGRVVDEASRRGDYGLACAPPPRVTAQPAPAPAPPVRPPTERAIEVCVLENGRLQLVPALLLETGDTLAIRNGDRLPLSAVHPDRGYAGESTWVRSGEAITLGRAKYIPYGAQRTISAADEAIPVGEFRGVPLFAEKGGGSTPRVVLVPVAPRCVVQPYHQAEDLRKQR